MRFAREYKLIVIGGSAGSLDLILRALSQLGPPISYSLVLVLHRKSSADSNLELLFSSRANVPVREVEHNEVLTPGTIYLAPADYHVLFEADGSITLDDSEKVNYSRPSIDVSFESAALAFGSSVAAILLSGANNDGSEGLVEVKRAGGCTIVQDTATAEFPAMPQFAIKRQKPDLILGPDEIISFLKT